MAEELGRGLRPADAPFLGPTLAAELRRLATGAPVASAAETVMFAPGLGAPAVAGASGMLPVLSVAIDSGSAARALVLLAGRDGHTLGEVAVQSVPEPVDTARPTGSAKPTTGVAATTGRRRGCTDDDVTPLDGPRARSDQHGPRGRHPRRRADGLRLPRAERHRSGTAIGSFQAVQHLLADAFVAMEGSRSATLHAAWAVDALPVDEALAAATVAKAYASRAARTVCPSQPSRCTAGSATRGSAWPTSTCAGPSSRRPARRHGAEPRPRPRPRRSHKGGHRRHRWTSVTHRPRPGSARA